MIHDHFDDHADAAIVRRGQKSLEVVQRAVARMNGGVIRDVVAVIAQRRRIKRQQPDGVGAQLLKIIEALRQPDKITDTVAIAVAKSAHVQLVNDRVFVPQVVFLQRQEVNLPSNVQLKIIH